MMIKAKTKDKRAAMLLYLATIALVIAAFTFLTIKVMEKPAKWEPKYIGEHQLALLKTGINANKLLLFIDQASKPTAVQSIYNIAQKGGFPAGSECGQYLGYEKWRTFLKDENKVKNCFPDDNTTKYDLAYVINNELYKYLNVYWGKAQQGTQVSGGGSVAPAQATAAGNKTNTTQGTAQNAPGAPADATGHSVLDITGAPIISTEPTTANQPIGVLGKIPPDNYEVNIEQKDRLRITGIAKEKAEFDIVIGPIKKSAAKTAAEAIETTVRGAVGLVDMEGCSIQDPGAGSKSIGHAYNGRLENSAELPFETEYVYTSPDRQKRYNNYGTRDLVVGMQKWGCSLKKTYDMKLFYGDMSDKDGGPLGRHKSHEAGRDVDLGLVFKSGNKKVMSIRNGVSDTNFDVEANWLLVETMFKTSDIQMIFLDTSLKNQLINWARSNGRDKDVIKKAENRIEFASGHNNHYHVRLMCPKEDSQCIDA